MPRGIYALEDEEAPWLKERLVFPSKAECTAWMKAHVDDTAHPSNPVVPHLEHIFTFLTSWEQVETYLLRKADEYDRRFPPRAPQAPISPTNVYAAALRTRAEDVKKEAPDEAEAETEEEVVPRASVAGVTAGLRARLDLPFHRNTNRESTRNTLSYLFNHMRCGIYVMIRHGKMRMFVPFVNAGYRNTWAHALTWQGPDDPPGTLGQDVEGYYEEKRLRTGGRKENVIPDVGEWWANGNIICNEHTPPGQEEAGSQYWGDQLLVPLRDMLHTLCDQRQVPDCEFFVNKRDYPHLKVHVGQTVSHGDGGGGGGAAPEAAAGPEAVPVEPYGFVFGCDDRAPGQDVALALRAPPPPHHHHGAAHTSSMAPIASFYCGAPDRFADLPLPTSEDWEAATGLIYPPSFKRERDRKTGEMTMANPRDLFTEENFKKFDCAWAAKRDTALFRGTATGGGVTAADNQRLACAALSHAWAQPQPGGEDAAAAAPPQPPQPSPPSAPTPPPARRHKYFGFLDAAITGWNRRDKKVWDKPMAAIDPKAFPFEGGKQNFVPIYEQSAYKYLLYIDGHCAACRYAFMMRLGSVILKVESAGVADRMWYFPLLRPWVDHVPVAPDLSDLGEKIAWCRAHDEQCRAMAAKAKAIYARYVGQSGLLDYLELFTHELAKRSNHAPPPWWQPPAPRVPPPSATAQQHLREAAGDEERFCDRGERYCARCAEERGDAAQAQEQEQRQRQEEEEEARKGRAVGSAHGGANVHDSSGGAGGALKRRKVMKKKKPSAPK